MISGLKFTTSTIVFFVLLLICESQARVFLNEPFLDQEKWRERWTVSDSVRAAHPHGEWSLCHVDEGSHSRPQSGLCTTEHGKFYAISSRFTDHIPASAERIIIQYEVRSPRPVVCGGTYVKLLSSTQVAQTDFSGRSVFNVLFGPDQCGPKRRILIVLRSRRGSYRYIRTHLPMPEDESKSHLYALVLEPDRFEVRVDGQVKIQGRIAEHWSVPVVTGSGDSAGAASVVSTADSNIGGSSASSNLQVVQHRSDDGDSLDFHHFARGNDLLGIEGFHLVAGSVFSNLLVTDDLALAEAKAHEFLRRVYQSEQVGDSASSNNGPNGSQHDPRSSSTSRDEL